MLLLPLSIGLLLTGILGWFLVRLTEGRTTVLTAWERTVFSLILGPTVAMLLVLVFEWGGMISLNLVGFMLPIIIASAVLAAVCWIRKIVMIPRTAVALPLSSKPHRAVQVIIAILLLWSAAKVAAGAVDLMNTPTYWDDSFNNWNMRGKLFYLDEKLTLSIPLTKETTQSAGGVSSYPPTVSLLKTWLSVINQEWSDTLVNSIHAVWYVLLVAGFYAVLRRRVTQVVSLLGVYALVSLPLPLIHGMNPYADIFLAMHLLLPIACLLTMLQTDDDRSMGTWLRLFCLSLGLFVFTKNEALLLYIPLLILGAAFVLRSKRHVLDRPALIRSLGVAIIILVACALPWLVFKWTHGLTFGNAKSVSGLALMFHVDALKAIWYQLVREPNFLLLPLLFPLTALLGWRHLKEPALAILAGFTTLAFLEHTAIFTLTPLANEAIMQTGVARGQVQFAPIALLFVLLMWERMLEKAAP